MTRRFASLAACAATLGLTAAAFLAPATADGLRTSRGLAATLERKVAALQHAPVPSVAVVEVRGGSVEIVK